MTVIIRASIDANIEPGEEPYRIELGLMETPAGYTYRYWDRSIHDWDQLEWMRDTPEQASDTLAYQYMSGYWDFQILDEEGN